MMVDSPAFEWTCQAIEGATELPRLAVRGTVRMALKKAGLDPGVVTQQQMQLVLEHVMPKELQLRGVAKAEEVCKSLITELATVDLASFRVEAAPRRTPEETFRRIFKGS